MIVWYGKEGDEVGEALLEGLEACRLNCGEIAFADEEGGLEIFVAINEHGGVAVVKVAECVLRIVGAARKAEPENVNGDTTLDEIEVSGGDGDSVAAVTADGEGSTDFNGAIRRVGLNADDLRAGVDETGDFMLHEEMEGWKLGCFGGEEVEKIPLRHKRDEFGSSGKMGEVWQGIGFVAEHHAEDVDLLMGLGE